MRLGELIKILRSADPDLVIRWGFGAPHSYRGNYVELAFDPAENVTVGSMLTHAESALNKQFTGYKGGEFLMDEHTDVWIANSWDGRDDEQTQCVGQMLLNYMLGKDKQTPVAG